MRPAPVAPTFVVAPRGGRRLVLVQPGPRVPKQLVGVEILRPCQWQPSVRRSGAAALAAAVLENACRDAGVIPGRATIPASRRALAGAWLAGELDAVVAYPCAVACAALGIDPAALAAVVSRTAAAWSAGRNAG